MHARPGSEPRGFVFAATWPYTVAAQRAARTLRQAMPSAQVDLFTDQPLQDDVFDRIHPLTDSFHRPKIEALRRSRFARTVYLDNDTAVLCDVSELFDLLDHTEFSACQGWSRAEAYYGSGRLPRAFPMLNSGVIALRARPATQDLLTRWETLMRDTGATYDQGCLREVLFDMGLPFMVLPGEYNVIHLSLLDHWPAEFGAPRILHVRALHRADPPGDPATFYRMRELLSRDRAQRLTALIETDPTWPEGAPRRGLLRVPGPKGRGRNPS